MRRLLLAAAALASLSGVAVAQNTTGPVANGMTSSNGAAIGPNGAVTSGVGVAQTAPGSSRSTPNVGAGSSQGTNAGGAGSGSNSATH